MKKFVKGLNEEIVGVDVPAQNTNTWEERWKLKFNEVLNRMYNLEILPFIQGTINERIPKEYSHRIFESEELVDFISKLLEDQRKQTIEEIRTVFRGMSTGDIYTGKFWQYLNDLQKGKIR